MQPFMAGQGDSWQGKESLWRGVQWPRTDEIPRTFPADASGAPRTSPNRPVPRIGERYWEGRQRMVSRNLTTNLDSLPAKKKKRILEKSKRKKIEIE